MPLTGHCLCNAVTYTIDVDQPALVGYDHCDDCQRQTGSTYCTLSILFLLLLKSCDLNVESLFANGYTLLQRSLRSFPKTS